MGCSQNESKPAASAVRTSGDALSPSAERETHAGRPVATDSSPHWFAVAQYSNRNLGNTARIVMVIPNNKS
ncbi:hypothetical protein, partial [Runella sp.]|uniref:hypothetical protein n=1 Tax=Runella sp. TaxID=1960881 RepID=UPI00301A6467